jgi:hypothetical protein
MTINAVETVPKASSKKKYKNPVLGLGVICTALSPLMWAATIGSTTVAAGAKEVLEVEVEAPVVVFIIEAVEPVEAASLDVKVGGSYIRVGAYEKGELDCT